MHADHADRSSRKNVPTKGTLLHAEVTGRILRAFHDVYNDDVYNDLGWSLPEIVYSRAMAVALRELGIFSEREAPLRVFFRGIPVGRFRAGFVVDRRVVVEVKAVERLNELHAAQLVNYLRVSGLQVGRLLNFGPDPTFRRLVLDTVRAAIRAIREQPRRSAFPPQPDGDDQI